jgi:hypothetical protein
MLLTIAGILIILWLIGVLAHIAAGFIHILLVIALIVVVYHFMVKGRTKV